MNQKYLLIGIMLVSLFVLITPADALVVKGVDWWDTTCKSGATGDTNYGTAANAQIGNTAPDPGRMEDAYIKFTNFVDINVTIDSALLWFYVDYTNSYNATLRMWTLEEADEAWVYTTITYNTRPYPSGLAIDTANTPSGTGWYSFDFTTLYNSKMGGASNNITLVFNGTDAGFDTLFQWITEEGANKPYVEINYSVAVNYSMSTPVMDYPIQRGYRDIITINYTNTSAETYIDYYNLYVQHENGSTAYDIGNNSFLNGYTLNWTDTGLSPPSAGSKYFIRVDQCNATQCLNANSSNFIVRPNWDVVYDMNIFSLDNTWIGNGTATKDFWENPSTAPSTDMDAYFNATKGADGSNALMIEDLNGAKYYTVMIYPANVSLGHMEYRFDNLTMFYNPQSSTDGLQLYIQNGATVISEIHIEQDEILYVTYDADKSASVVQSLTTFDVDTNVSFTFSHVTNGTDYNTFDLYYNKNNTGWLQGATSINAGDWNLADNIVFNTGNVSNEWVGFFDNITFNDFSYTPVPVIDDMLTSPSSPDYEDTITFYANVSISGGLTIDTVLCSLYYPNGTAVFEDDVATGTGSYTCPTTYIADDVFGTFTWTINATGNGVTTDGTEYFNINFPTPVLSLYTGPTSPAYYNNVTIWANITYSELLQHANFSLTYPNGSFVFENVNGTVASDTWHSIQSYAVSSAGTFNYWVNTTTANGTDSEWDSFEIVTFASTILCNITNSGNKMCGGVDGRYLYECVEYASGTYQWDTLNVSYCEFGCYFDILSGYNCKSETVYCDNKCNPGSRTCSTDGQFSFNCTKVATGCYGWSDIGLNKTTCEYGCIKGQCTNVSGSCNIGDQICIGDYVYYCGDYNGDGLNEYNEFNSTFCEQGCMEIFNEDTGFVNATCNWHSYDDVYEIRNSATDFTDMIEYVGYSPNVRIAIWIIITFLVAGFVAWMSRDMDVHNGKIILLILLISTVLGIFTDWIPWGAGIIILIIGGMLYVYSNKQDVED